MPRKPAKPKASQVTLDFAALVDSIRHAHDHSAAVVNRVVNTSLTLRNWVIGAYIVEYELHGEDRAKYGSRIVEKLAETLEQRKVPTCDRPRLFAYIAFFRAYPHIYQVVANSWPELMTRAIGNREDGIVRSLTGQSEAAPNDPPIPEKPSGE